MELKTKVSAELPVVVIFDLRKIRDCSGKSLLSSLKTILDPSIVPQIKAETRGYNIKPRY